MVVTLVEETEDAEAAEVDGTLVLHVTQRTIVYYKMIKDLLCLWCTKVGHSLLHCPGQPTSVIGAVRAEILSKIAARKAEKEDRSIRRLAAAVTGVHGSNTDDDNYDEEDTYPLLPLWRIRILADCHRYIFFMLWDPFNQDLLRIHRW